MTGRAIEVGVADHPWEARVPPLWRIASDVAAVLVVGLLVAIGIGLPPVLPVALAGAFRISVRRARGLAVHPLSDAIAGIREDWMSVMTVVVVLAVAIAPGAWLAGIGLAGATGVTAGVRLAVLAACAFAIAPLVVGCTVAAATSTPARHVPRAAVGIALGAPRASTLVVVTIALGLVPLGLTRAESFLPVSLGVAVVVATGLAWRAVARVAEADGG